MIWPWSALSRLRNRIGELDKSVLAEMEAARRWKKRYMGANDELNKLHPALTELNHKLELAGRDAAFLRAQITSLEEERGMLREDLRQAAHIIQTNTPPSQYLFNDDPFAEQKNQPDEFYTPPEEDLVDARAVEAALDKDAQASEQDA